MKKLFNSKRFMSLVLTLLMIVSSIAWDGLTVEAAITYGDNLIQNGGFETAGAGDGDLFDAWTETGSVAVVSDTNAYEGNNSLNVINKNTYVTQSVTVEVGKEYMLTGYIKMENARLRLVIGGSTVYIASATGGYTSSNGFEFFDAEGKSITAPAMGEWCKFSYKVAPTTTSLEVSLRGQNGGYYDNIELREKIEVASDTGLVLNGDFETAGTGEGNDVFANWTETVGKEDNELIVDGYTGSAVQVNANEANTVEQVLAVETGKTYELTGYINMNGARAYTYINGTRLHFDLRADSETVTNSMTPHIIFESASGNPVDAPVQNGWFKFSYLVTATADTMNLKLAGKSGLALFDDISLHEATDVINVTEVALDKNELTLQEGFEATLSATFAPADAKYQTVAWTSNKPDVATVDRNGKVTAVAAGTATITATSNNGISATCTVMVPAPFNGGLIENGGFETLTEDGTFFEGWTQAATGESFIVNADDTANYTSIKEGNYSLVVKQDNVGAARIIKVDPGKTYEFTGYFYTNYRAFTGITGYSDEAATIVTDSNQNCQYKPNPANPNFYIENENGELTSIGKQFAWIKFYHKITVSDQTNYLKITLGSYTKAGANYWTMFDNVALREVVVPVESVTLDETLALAVGGEATLTATVLPNNASDKTITWTTSADNVATVDENGKVTAVAEGTAIITATSNNGFSAACTVTVTDPAISVNGAPFDGTLLEAIAAAEENSVIKLNKDVDTEGAIIDKETYFTLDLNGCTLTVGSFGKYVNVVDNSEEKTGLLKVAADACTLPPMNEQMPVYDAINGGYVFTTMKDQNDGGSITDNAFKLIFRPSFGAGTLAKNTLLANGGVAAGITIGIRLDWTEPVEGEFVAKGYGDAGNAVRVFDKLSGDPIDSVNLL